MVSAPLVVVFILLMIGFLSAFSIIRRLKMYDFKHRDKIYEDTMLMVFCFSGALLILTVVTLSGGAE